MSRARAQGGTWARHGWELQGCGTREQSYGGEDEQGRGHGRAGREPGSLLAARGIGSSRAMGETRGRSNQRSVPARERTEGEGKGARYLGERARGSRDAGRRELHERNPSREKKEV
jgi:hypothetical protein